MKSRTTKINLFKKAPMMPKMKDQPEEIAKKPQALERKERLNTPSFRLVSCFDSHQRLLMVELISLFSNVSAQMLLDTQTILQHLRTFTSPIHLVCNFSSMTLSFESCFQMLQQVDPQLFADANPILAKHISHATILCNPAYESLFSVFLNIFNPPIPTKLGTILSRS